MINEELTLRKMVCANGETAEWSLYAGDHRLAEVWLVGASRTEAMAQLLKALVRGADNGASNRVYTG